MTLGNAGVRRPWQVSVDGGGTWGDAPFLDAPTISGMPPAYLNGWELRAVFTNGGGTAVTPAVTLTVTEGRSAEISSSPAARFVPEGAG